MKAAVIGCGAQGRGGHVANYAKMDEVSLWRFVIQTLNAHKR